MALAPWAFSTFTVSVLAAKLLHLWIFVSTISIFKFLLYLPTFFFLDAIVIGIARLLLRPPRGIVTFPTFILGFILSIVTLGGASSQYGFYIRTGGELDWREASAYATNKEGLNVLLSGSFPVTVSGLAMLVIAWLLRNVLYKYTGLIVNDIGHHIVSVCTRTVRFCNGDGAASEYDSDSDEETDPEAQYSNYSGSYNGSEDESESSSPRMMDHEKPFSSSVFSKFRSSVSRDSSRQSRGSRYNKSRSSRAIKVVGIVYILILFMFRPNKPYDHMSITLPVDLLQVMHTQSDPCIAKRKELIYNQWPFPDQIGEPFWEEANGDFKGWAPEGKEGPGDQYFERVPDWLPTEVPHGFTRWDPRKFSDEYFGPEVPSPNRKDGRTKNPVAAGKCPPMDYRDGFYSPVDDPLKISNLDSDILAPIRGALEDGSVKIKHVVFILMESLREELFPLQQGSDIHNNILQYNDEASKDEVNLHLSQLTPHTELITGKPGNFRSADGHEYPAPELVWNDTTEAGFGGVNVVGGFTGATVSTKSFATYHCGTWSMAVEKFDEADTEAYQPCLPQIMGLFNQIKTNSTDDSDDYREHRWSPAFFQSMTDEYDRQNKFDMKIGFDYILTKKQLKKDKHDRTDPMYKQVNYFSYPEPVLKPHIVDYVQNATANNQRIFLSHFTSSTHHAWDVPKTFPTQRYLRKEKPVNWHEGFDKYLNTIRYHDTWMGELMQLFQDTGIANETLIVFAGDHGQAFKEDYSKTGTYENGHVSNFRVPITFRHPHLPRYQYEANATTMSVLPTVLDLLINSGSLNTEDTRIASDLIQDYEGQSLIRPYKTTKNGRRAWNFSVINSGAGMMAVTSADAPWRLVIPLEKVTPFRLSDLRNDPTEVKLLSAWSRKELVRDATARYGEEVVSWIHEAIEVSKWWRMERQRLWRHY